MSLRDIIAIGGSFGAVPAVLQLCRDLPADLAATVFVVIHVGAEGHDQLADIFNEHSPLSVGTAVDGEAVRRGHVYVAPADRHLLVIDDRVRLGHGPRENMARPAIDPLFRSAAACFGPRVIAVVLTGFLNDGAAGLAAVKRCGGLAVVQNPGDAQAPDMPMSALKASNVDYRAPLGEMATLLAKLSREKAGPRTAIPADVRTEVEIALGNRMGSEVVAEFADPVPLSCPSCGGVLSQVRHPPLRFRCQVGHAYSADVLTARQEDSADEALRVAPDHGGTGRADPEIGQRGTSVRAPLGRGLLRQAAQGKPRVCACPAAGDRASDVRGCPSMNSARNSPGPRPRRHRICRTLSVSDPATPKFAASFRLLARLESNER